MATGHTWGSGDGTAEHAVENLSLRRTVLRMPISITEGALRGARLHLLLVNTHKHLAAQSFAARGRLLHESRPFSGCSLEHCQCIQRSDAHDYIRNLLFVWPDNCQRLVGIFRAPHKHFRDQLDSRKAQIIALSVLSPRVLDKRKLHLHCIEYHLGA